MLYYQFKILTYNDPIKRNEEVIKMNKIKLMYDVVKTMKEKEVSKGTLKVKRTENQETEKDEFDD